MNTNACKTGTHLKHEQQTILMNIWFQEQN